MATITNHIDLTVNSRPLEAIPETIRGIAREYTALRRTAETLPRSSQEYVNATAQVAQLRGILDEHNTSMRTTQTLWQRLVANAQGFAPALAGAFTGNILAGGLKSLVSTIKDVNAEVSDLQSDVIKTAGLTKDEVQQLTTELKNIDTRTPIQELLKISAIGGQLGISGKEGVEAFTKSVDKLSVALSDEFAGGAEEVTQEVGKLSNVMFGVTNDGVKMSQNLMYLGNALNVLASEGSATAPVMADFANRIGGIGIPLGLTQGQVLGLSATLQELNINAERGGTGTAKILTALANDTENFAKVLGLPAKEFTSLVQTDLYGAFNQVITKVKELGTSNTEVSNTLKALKIDGIGELEVFMKLANSQELLATKTDTATTALKSQNSINAEFETKNNNAAASLEKMQNAMQELLISEGVQNTMAAIANGAVIAIEAVKPLFEVIGGIMSLFTGTYQTASEAMLDMTADAIRSSSELNNTVTPLLNTYEELTAKAESLGGTTKLTAEEQDNLKAAAKGVADEIPGVITSLDEYGNVLSINTDKARAFVATQVAMGEQARELRKQLLAQRQTELETGIAQAQEALQKGSIGGLIDVDLKKQNELIAALQTAQAEIKRNAAELDALNGKTQNQPEATKAATGLPIGGVDAKAAEKAKADRQKVADDVQKDATNLNEALARLQHEYEKSKLDSDERILVGISDKYEKEIVKARELANNKKATDAQRADAAAQLAKLEELRDQELAAKKDELMQAHLRKVQETNAKLQEETDKYYAAEAKKTEDAAKARADAQESILKYVGEVANTALQNAYADAEREFNALFALAEKNNIDTVKLHESYEKKKAEITKKYQAEQSKTAIEATQKNAQMYAASFGAMADIAGSLLSLFDEKTRKSSVALKALTLINIGLNMAAGIAAAVAAGAGVPFPGNLVAIASGVGAVLAGISQAKAVFAGDQKKDGGYTVIGPKDGRTYNADYIGSPNTGLLPPAPKLILANEAGQEYFVAAHHLKNPMVANHVRMIDTITRQYANGGYTDAPSSPSTTADTSGADNGALMQFLAANMAVLNNLNDKLDKLAVKISYPDAANIADMSDEARRLKK